VSCDCHVHSFAGALIDHHPLCRVQALQATKTSLIGPRHDADASAEAAKPVLFRVRLRKQGGRGDDDSKRIEVPSSSAIAASLRAQRAHEDVERKELKKLVLAAERSQVAEERIVAAEAKAAAGGRAGGRGSRSYLSRRKQDSGFRMEESSFHSEVRNVRGAL
jgi:hypothetical protein